MANENQYLDEMKIFLVKNDYGTALQKTLRVEKYIRSTCKEVNECKTEKTKSYLVAAHLSRLERLYTAKELRKSLEQFKKDLKLFDGNTSSDREALCLEYSKTTPIAFPFCSYF